MKRSYSTFWLFLLPCLAAFSFTVAGPFITGIYYSFTNWKGIGTPYRFIGFQNYIDAISEPEFLASFWFSTKFTVLSVILQNAIGFFLALLVTRGLKISNTSRTIFFIPNLIGGLVLGFIWQFIFVEAFRQFAELTKISAFDGWLSDANTGFWALIILMTWQTSGYLMVIYIASIQSIPEELMEASELDGANFWQKVRFIIFPMVAPAFTVSLFISLSGSLKLYDQNFSLTAGGPARQTEMIAMNIVMSFNANKVGLSEAKGVIFFILIALVSFVQINMTKRNEIQA